MIETVTAAWDALMHVLNTAPMGLWSLLLSLLFSGLVTQWLKFYVPIEWPAPRRAGTVRLLAFFLAVTPMFFMWPTAVGIMCGAIIGVISPVAYAVSVRLIGLKWPAIRDLLSQDVRNEQ